MPVAKEQAEAAIRQACTALRRRKAVEEGGYASIVSSLELALSNKGEELQSKVDSLQQELSQCYRTQAQVSEQLVHEMQTAQSLRGQLAEKEELLLRVQDELESTRKKLREVDEELKTKEASAALLLSEVHALRTRVKELEKQCQDVEAENKMLVDRWMTQKMLDAERLNEANAMYADMMERLKASSLAELAKQQVDGIVRSSEANAESYMSGPPAAVRHTVRAHDRGCAALAFQHHSETLVSAGHDNLVKFWETTRGASTTSLTGALGSVMDIAISSENALILGGCSDHKVYLWDVRTGRIKHVMTGHMEKVPSVDIIQGTNRRAVSSSYDRTLKIWDLQTGYNITSILCHSTCNSLCVASDIICSGHTDGTLRFWDARTGKQANEVMAHEPHAITSVSLSRSGLTVLTTGRDNVLHMLDVRTMEKKTTFAATGFTVPTNFSRSSMSSDESYVVSGSSDGNVFVWNRNSGEVEAVLKGHSSPVTTCAWGDLGKSLASADKNGNLCIWE